MAADQSGGWSEDLKGGVLLIGCTVLAMVCANSKWGMLYVDLLSAPLQVGIGAVSLEKTILHWINDGLMALFFLLVGLEIRREMSAGGHLAGHGQIRLPGIAALGGMVVPALLYALCNQGHADWLRGWAIPSATDIAFALGILAILGTRVPPALKLFVMALAVLDDLGAVLVIALFYSGALSSVALAGASACILALWLCRRGGLRHGLVYLLLGLALWVSVLKSGVHATLAGVVVAFLLPSERIDGQSSLMVKVEHTLQPWVRYAIVPVFAFANAGIPLAGLRLDDLTHPVLGGIVLGLFVGKQVGIFGSAALAIRLGWASLPVRTSWRQLHAAAVLCGIGFTMSLFISGLAFEAAGITVAPVDRLGILLASVLSAGLGFGLLRTAPVGQQAGVRPRGLR